MATIPLDIVANTKDAIRAIKRLEVQSKDSFGSITGAIGKLSIGITGLNQGFQLASAGARFLADGLAATVGQALEFEESIAEISTLLNDATVGTEELGKTVLDLQKQFGGNQKVIAGAFYNAISSGAVDAGKANLFLADANKLAVGGVTDLDTAVDGLTTIISGFGLKAEDTKEISDSLFIAMQKGKTTVGELSRGVGIAAASASSLGVDFKELLAATSALTTGGITTSVAFTQVRSALTGLSKPSTELQKILDDLNITSIKAAISQDGMVGTLKRIIAETDGSAEAMSKLFGSVEAIQGVTALTSDVIGGTFQDALKQMGSAAQNSGDTTETAFKKIADTAKFQFDKLKGIVSASFTGIGKEITKRITPVLKTLQGIAGTLGTAFKKGVAAAAKAFSKSKLFKSDSIGKTLLKGINLALEGFNLLQKAIVLVSKGILNLAIDFTKFGGANAVFVGVSKSMILIDELTTQLAKGFLIALRAKAKLFGTDAEVNELTKAIAEADKASVALALKFDKIKGKNFDELEKGLILARDGIAEVGEALTVAIDATTESLTKGVEKFGKAAGDIKVPSSDAEGDRRLGQLAAGKSNGAAVPVEVEQTSEFSKSLEKAGKKLGEQGAEFGKLAISSFSKGGEEGAKQLVAGVGGAIGNAFGIPGVGEALQLLMTDGAADLVTGVLDALPTIIERLAQNMPAVALALIEVLGNPLFYIRVANAFVDGLTTGIDKAATRITDKFNFAIGEGFIEFKNKMAGFAVSIREGFNEIWNNFAADFIAGWVPVRDAILGPFQAIERILHGIVNKVTEFFNRISGSEAGGAVSKAGSDIKDFVGLAGGGIVPSGFNDDTFPARLTSGEAVIKRDTTEELANFLDRQGGVEALLAQLVEIVSRPMTVQSSVEVDGQAFADINLELSRTGARTA